MWKQTKENKHLREHRQEYFTTATQTFFLNKEITKKSLQQHQGIEIETAAPLKANSTLPTLTRYTNIKAVFSHNYYFCLRERYKSLSPYNAVENDM